MAQSLSNIICKSQLQAIMATSAGRTNVLSNPKLGKTVSHALTSATVDVAYSFKATGTSSGTDEFFLTWGTGITEHEAGSVTFTMRDNPTATSAETQQDPEGINVATITTLVAVQVDVPSTNTAAVEILADSDSYGGGPHFFPEVKLHGGTSTEALARSMLIVPRVAVSTLPSPQKSRFKITGASGNNVTVSVFGKA